MPGTPTATVVVVAWNGTHLIDDCLDALAKQEVPDGFLTWVIDNASADDTAARVAQHPLAPRLISPPRNLGFAGAAALAVDQVTTPIVVLLNQDAVVEPGWLAELLAPFDAPDVGAVTSKVLFTRDGRLNNTGLLIGHDGYGRDRGFEEPDDGRYAAPEDVFGFSGTACALRVSAARAVGSFDAAFFMYYEDADLSWRLRSNGWRVRYQPSAVVRHQHAASSDVRSVSFAFFNERNRLLTLAKNAPVRRLVREVLRFTAITLLLPLRRLRGVAIPEGHQFRTSLRLRVLASFLKLLPAMLRKRSRTPSAHPPSREKPA